MEYIHRELERKFSAANHFFKAILVIGARQVGKSTMLRQMAREQDRTYVTMDRERERQLARTDPALFFQTYPTPILIDEIQKAPELLNQIKLMCDAGEERGRFWLTGSQRRKLMERAQETLAGRLGILRLYSLSQREKVGYLDPPPLDFSLGGLRERQAHMPANDVREVYRQIWQGGFADVQNASAEMAQLWYESYVENYLIADAVNDEGIKDVAGFRRFIRACAALIGQLVNIRTLAETAGVSQPTAKKWLGILQDMDVICLLEPYSNNELQRMVKTPKLYFCDTGLCAYLSRWLTPETLMEGAAAGAYYENYAVMELVRNYAYAPDQAILSFYRDDNAKEIDVFVEENGAVHPLEIKKSANPPRQETRKFRVLEKTSLRRGPGGIICMADEPFPIDETDLLIPGNLI